MAVPLARAEVAPLAADARSNTAPYGNCALTFALAGLVLARPISGAAQPLVVLTRLVVVEAEPPELVVSGVSWKRPWAVVPLSPPALTVSLDGRRSCGLVTRF